MKSLESENAELKKMPAKRMMDVAMLKEMLDLTSEAGPRKNSVNCAMKTKGANQRRANAFAGIDLVSIDGGG